MKDTDKKQTAEEISLEVMRLKAANWDEVQRVGELQRVIADCQNRVNERQMQIDNLTRQLTEPVTNVVK